MLKSARARVCSIKAIFACGGNRAVIYEVFHAIARAIDCDIICECKRAVVYEVN